MQPPPASTVGGVAKMRQARKCRAHRKGDGQPCGNYAITGGYVCRMHSGAAPQVKRKARERLVEAAAYKTLDGWVRSPAYAEYRERAALAGDQAAVEAFAERLAR